MNDWRPAAPTAVIRRRAALLADLRAYFAQRGVLEVETPLLDTHGVTDPALENLTVTVAGGSGPRELYLQTSPEYAMKRMLADGCGPIYQLGRAFRAGEAGRRHRLEFTLLEWYRPGFDLEALMTETADLVRYCGIAGTAQRTSYFEAFRRHAGVDLDDPDPLPLARAAAAVDARLATGGPSRALLQDLVFSHRVAPHLGRDGPELLFDYPLEQAALAAVAPGPPPRARRFELFIDGLELANGFEELRDAAEQRRRFEADNAVRRRQGQAERALDERLLAALGHGLPPVSGVALGVDRLLMTLEGVPDIAQTQAFSVEIA